MSQEQEILNWWLNRNGFFTLQSIAAKNKTIAILAIKTKDLLVSTIWHIELNCSIVPQTGFGADDKKSRLKEYIYRKFEDPAIKKTIEEIIADYIGKSKSYEKVLVLGALTNKKKITTELNNHGIKLLSFEDIIAEVYHSLDRFNYRNPVIRNLQLSKYLMLYSKRNITSFLKKSKSKTKQSILRGLLQENQILPLPIIKQIAESGPMTKPTWLFHHIDNNLSLRSKNQLIKQLSQKNMQDKAKKHKPLSYFLRVNKM